MSKSEVKRLAAMGAPINLMLDAVVWSKVERAEDAAPGTSGLPYVTHEGVLSFSDFSLRAYQLSDGRRVFNSEDLENFFMAGLLPR